VWCVAVLSEREGGREGGLDGGAVKDLRQRRDRTVRLRVVAK